MPTLPVIDGPRPTPQPSGAIVSDSSGAIIGEALTGLGRAFEHRAEYQRSEMEKQQREDDAQAVFSARRKLDDWERATIFDPKDGAINKLGKDALDLPAVIPKSFDEFAGQVGQGLSNQRQRNAYEEVVQSRRNQITDWTNRHTLQQREIYNRGQFEADLQSMRDRAGQFATDPARVKAEMDAASTRIVGYMRGKGLSEEETQAKIRDQANKTHIAVLDTLLAGDDWRSAQKYLTANAEQMDPPTVLRLHGALRKQEDVVEGAKAAQGVIQSVQPQMRPTDMDRVINITMQSESGGRRYGKDGALLTSSAGAQGEMQVMPKTATDPGFGVAPAKDRSPEELARVGRDYLGAMVKKYGGDMGKAWAAYNGGPGAVDAAVKEADKDAKTGAFRTAPPADYWLQKMPSETQAYVAKNLKAFNDGAGFNMARPTLLDVQTRVREQLAGQRPERIKAALEEADRLYRVSVEDIKQRDDEAVVNAQRELLQNGGSWVGVPTAIRNAVPPGKVDDLMKLGERIAKGQEQTNFWLYNKLVSDPAKLAKMSDNEVFKLRSEFTESDFKHVVSIRAAEMKPGASNGPGELNTAAINAALSDRLSSLNVDPTPKDKTTEAQQVGALRRYINDSILAAQQQTGKKMSDAEVAKHIDGLFAKTETVSGFFGDTGKPRLAMKPGDIPSADAQALRMAFRRRGITSPSDGQLLEAYWQVKGGK